MKRVLGFDGDLDIFFSNFKLLSYNHPNFINLIRFCAFNDAQLFVFKYFGHFTNIYILMNINIIF